MFLSRLYKFNRSLFILFIGFLLIFIFINVKQGAVSTPVYQYGMFSEPFFIGQERDAFIFTADGERIPLEKLSFPLRDNLIVSLQNYLVSSEYNARVYSTMERLIGPFVKLPKTLSETASAQKFNRWYIDMVSRLCNMEIRNLEVQRRGVYWHNALVLTPTTSKIFPVAE